MLAVGLVGQGAKYASEDSPAIKIPLEFIKLSGSSISGPTWLSDPGDRQKLIAAG